MAEKKLDFKNYLAPNNILCRADACDGIALLIRLLAMLKRHFPALDIDSATEEVLAREKLYPTVIAPGLAVPHARIAGLTQPLIAMACCPGGVEFNGAEPVKVMILLLSPLSDPNSHMQLLAGLAADFAKTDAIAAVAALATPSEVIGYFAGRGVAMPEYLTAADVLSPPPAVLHETDTLAQALPVFATSRADELPVIDREGDLRGVVSLTDLLKFSLPEHLLWMEDLSPIYRFQPFADVLASAGDTRIADVMREEFLKVESQVPAIQLAKLFLVYQLPQLVIVDKAGRLAGVVDRRDFCAKLFWK